MRKNCVQSVETSGKLLVKVLGKYTVLCQILNYGDKTRTFYLSYKHAIRNLFHAKNQQFVSVSGVVMPTIHMTYKDYKKLYRLNLSTSRSAR